MFTLRSALWPQDAVGLTTLDMRFSTDRIYRPIREELFFRLEAVDVSPPLQKQYPFSPADPGEQQSWDCAVIAEEEGRLAGFAAAQFVSWNRRVTLHHLYVTPGSRGKGIGTRLLTEVEAFARSRQARCLWLETQNVNYPAIQFYLRTGFTFCGFDDTLYDLGTLLQEEVALFFARPVDPLPAGTSDTPK